MKLLSGIIELKKGWYIRLPYPMTEMEMSRYRFGPLIVPLLIAGAGVSALGQIQQGKAADAQAKTEQAILEQNAQLAERQAEREREAARIKAGKFQTEGERLIATQQVQFAKGGVLTTVGTPAEVLELTADELDKERLAILKEGFARGEFEESRAFGLRFQGEAARARGKNIKRGSRFAAGASILSGLGGALTARSLLRK